MPNYFCLFLCCYTQQIFSIPLLIWFILWFNLILRFIQLSLKPPKILLTHLNLSCWLPCFPLWCPAHWPPPPPPPLAPPPSRPQCPHAGQDSEVDIITPSSYMIFHNKTYPSTIQPPVSPANLIVIHIASVPWLKAVGVQCQCRPYGTRVTSC